MPVRGKVTFDIEIAKYALPYRIVSMIVQLPRFEYGPSAEYLLPTGESSWGLVNCQTARATMMIRTIETAIFFRTPKECPTLSIPRRPFRDVLLIDFLSSYTSIRSDARRGS